jgi:NosR/NirI family nitrous oxide reductase transcriptional regulator
MGRNLLGPAEYDNLKQWLLPGEQAVLIMANGDYSFRGSGFVRGAIFDRFQMVQGDLTMMFRDKQYRRLGSLAEGMPEFAEIGLFKIPADRGFEPTQGWRIDLLAQRALGTIDKAFVTFELAYIMPEKYLHRQVVTVSPAQPSLQTGMPDQDSAATALWQRIWEGRTLDVVILSLALFLLTGVFFLQDHLVSRYPVWVRRVRFGFWLFSALWLGAYAHAQLSVVNVFTFIHALMTGFKWDIFLLEPLLFILWSATAVAMLFWGRGAYCGWLCAFGALQSLLNQAARKFGIPQYRPRYAWHERFMAVKYVLFLGLFGLSLYSMAMAEQFAEVEPFKTVMVLQFQRHWPFVLWAVVLLGAGLFIERFFCRYLCPLGAALAIPGRIRIFDWLKRRRQCGYECSLCGRDCMVQAIHPVNGQIHPNECHYCLDCQLYHADEQICPPLISRRKRRENRAVLQARVAEHPSMASVDSDTCKENCHVE